MQKYEIENFVSDSKLVECIKNYIDGTSYNYAVMIDGGWGCGKTYFINKVLIKELREYEKLKAEKQQKKIIYISLYGVASKEDLTRQIWIETLPFNFALKNKKFNMVSNIGKVALKGALSFNGISFEGNLIDINDFLSLENCTLIFDDLERCNMEINEVLGYINSFVEHDGVKTIIVANEKEIIRGHRVINEELKFMLALNTNLEFPQKAPSKNPFEKDNKSSSDKIDIKELNRRKDILFRENEIYKKVKEKLIGITFHFRPNIDDVIDTILKTNITDKAVKEVVIKNKNFIIEKTTYYEHINIRTLLFAIDKYAILSKGLLNSAFDMDIKNILDEIFKYTLVFSILYKSGGELPKWTNENSIESLRLGDMWDHNSYIKGFKFVDELVLRGNVFNDNVIDIVKSYIRILKEQIKDPSDPLFKITQNWCYLEDQEVKELLYQINDNLLKYPLKYPISNYYKIILYNVYFNRLGIIEVDMSDVFFARENSSVLQRFFLTPRWGIFVWLAGIFYLNLPHLFHGSLDHEPPLACFLASEAFTSIASGASKLVMPKQAA